MKLNGGNELGEKTENQPEDPCFVFDKVILKKPTKSCFGGESQNRLDQREGCFVFPVGIQGGRT